MNQVTVDHASTSIEVTCSLRELSYDEQQEREYLERLVERAFYEAGKGLRALRDKKLYRSTHNSFEQYCKERFGFERRQPYRLIEAAGVIDNIVEMCPNGTHLESLDDPMCPNRAQILPTNERQIRPLTKLEPSQQRECWRQAVKAAGDKVPSGRQVKDIVDRIRERTKVPNPYREGDICILIPKDNPELRGKSGCWGAITHVGEYSCTIKTLEAEYTVKIEHLLSMELSDDNCKFMRELLGRMRCLHQLPDCDGAVNSLLAYFGKQSQPYLSPIQEELLVTIERNYGIGEPKQ
ncbi:hypothetical protein NIES2101_43785 [Calothrix sp. HK-06]|nr:hypothetical protein NIES2101_43785 [Calothrix sp. HK-06]